MLLNIVFIFFGFLIVVIFVCIIIFCILIIFFCKRLFDMFDIWKVYKKFVFCLGGVFFFFVILFIVIFFIGVCDKMVWIFLVDIVWYWI